MQPNPKMPKDFEARFDGLLNPEKIQHDGALEGSSFLRSLPPERKFQLFCALCLDKASPEKLAETIANNEGEERWNLTAALRRLSIIGTPLASDIKKTPQKAKSGRKKAKPEKLHNVSLAFNPGISLADHVAAAELAPKDFDCVSKMASLSSLLETQLKSLYVHPSRSQNPFMMVRDVNMVSQTYMNALEKLHKMQIDVGIVEKTPEKMEVDMQHIGAFQTYIGELSTDQKAAMADFANVFGKFVQERTNDSRTE